MKSLFNLSPHAGKTSRVQPTTHAAKALLIIASRILAIAIISLAGLTVMENQASAQVWTLTKAQRQAYLNYYAPVILKRGDENNDKQGRDWITNFDFDQDGDFSNNRVNWLNINRYVAASATGPSAYDRWRIRPTLYTALIEYMEGGSKSLVLLYHVYNAADKDGSDIHDWERVEIVVRGISGTPGGSSEYVNHVTVTLHTEHVMRRYYDSGLNFMQTATGKHVLLWQADESNDVPPAAHAHELRYVTNPYSWVASQVNSPTTSAEVNISGKDEKKNIHYAFVPEGSPAAVTTWGARPLSYATATSLASRVDNGNTVAWYQVKRITYELQDIADIFPTHWQYNPWYIHWLSSNWTDVLLESPIINEAGQSEVSTGLQRFYTKSRNVGNSNLEDGRSGVPDKRWFYGAYSAELNSEFSYFELDYTSDNFKGFEGIGLDSSGLSRGAASGYYNSHNAFWWQHDYFVHSGIINSADTREEGTWLRGAWYMPANGGFDGRWAQLFDDRAGLEPYTPPTPLSLSITLPTNRCTEMFLVTAKATGGQSPYTFTWTNADPISTANDPNNRAYVYAYGQASVTVRGADGETRTANLNLTPSCTGGQQLP